MKRLAAVLTVVLGLPITITKVAGAEATSVNSRITDVTVYPDRAKVIRTTTITLPAGDHTLVFDTLPVGAQNPSFRASVTGPEGTMLLGLNHRVVQHLITPREKLAELEKEIQDLKWHQQEPTADHITVLEAQKEMLMAILNGGQQRMADQLENARMDVKTWEDAYRFFGSRILLITDSLRDLRHELELINRRIDHKSAQLREQQSARSTSSKTVEVGVRAARAGEVQISLEYMIAGASWQPLYDARLLASSDTVVLSSYAEVTQKTGEDWTDVDLSLSTARPALGVSPGEFKPWYLKAIVHGAPVTTVGDLLKVTRGIVAEREAETMIRGGRASEVSYLLDVAKPNEVLSVSNVQLLALPQDLGLSTVFVVQRKETVPSGAEAIRAPLGRWSLEATGKLITRPRNVGGAFRDVTMVNQEQAPLMPGVVNVFAESDYLGKTMLLDLVTPGQEFTLPFGREPELTVKREQISRKRFDRGERIRIEQTFEITLKNNGKASRAVLLEEPMPTSEDSRVKVKVLKTDPEADSVDEKGKAMWNLTLAPGEEITVTLSYRIEHPDDLLVSNF